MVMNILITEQQLKKFINRLNEDNHNNHSLSDLKKAFYAGRDDRYSSNECQPEYRYDDFEDYILHIKQNPLRENTRDNKKTKENLQMIAALATKLYEAMSDENEIDEWMIGKIAEAEQGIAAVTNAYLHGDDVKDKIRGMNRIDFNDLIIGQ